MDKKRITLILRILLANDITIEEATQKILDLLSVSKRFNSTNFLVGMAVGGLIGLISIAIATS